MDSLASRFTVQVNGITCFGIWMPAGEANEGDPSSDQVHDPSMVAKIYILFARLEVDGMLYPMLAPPFEFDSFETMTKAQAQRHFDWYIPCIPERVKLLEEWVNRGWGCSVRFDYSLESLDPLWEAFEKHIEIEVKSEDQVRAENEGVPEYVMDELLKDRRDLTTEMYAIALDIGMYFGETLVRCLPGLHWGFFTRPKSMLSVNKPVVLGFRNNDYLDPRHMVLVGCYKLLDGPNPRHLSRVVEIWKGELPEG